MQRVGQLGGLVSAVTTDGVTALAAEGESLLRLDIFRDGPPLVVASVNLEHGLIQNIIEAFPLTYVLTEEGLVVMQGVHDAPLPQPGTFVPGGGQAMTLGPGAVYIAARDAGLRVIDVSVPQQAHTLAELTLPGQAGDVAFSPDGALALVAAGEDGLHVVSFQDPTQPVLAGTLDTATPVNSVTVTDSVLGPLAYLSSESQVYALTLPDPTQLGETQVIGLYDPLRDGRHITVSPDGDFAYVADGDGGLKIYDITKPDQALQVYGDPAGTARGPALDVALSPEGDLAVVAAGEIGLRILDVTNPFSPVERFVVSLPGAAEGVAFSQDGGRAFVALGPNGLAVVVVTTAAVLNIVPLDGHAHTIITDGRWAYVANGDAGLVALNIDQPGAETATASLELPGEALDLTLRGDTLFVAAGEAGLVAVDVIRPAEPRLVGQLSPEIEGSRYFDIGVFAKRAFVADGQGVAFVDVADPARMVHLTRLDGEATRAVALAEEGIDVFLYVLSDSQIASYEVSISTAPILLGAYRPTQQVGRIIPHGDQLLLTNAGDGPQVLVLNVSNPRLPREVGWYGDKGHSLHAASHEDAVLIAGGLEGLVRLEFDGEARLAELSAYNPLPDLTRVAAGDSWVVAGGGQGWSLVNSEDSANLKPMSRAGASLRVRDLARSDNEVIVATGQMLASFDLGDPSTPQLAHTREFGGLANGVALSQDYVFVADGGGGLEIFTRDGLRPVTRIPLPAGANGIALDPVARLVYLALDDGSLALVDVADPTGGLRALGTLALGSPASLSLAPDGGQVLALAGRELSLLNLETNRSGELVRLEQTRLPHLGRAIAWDGEQLILLAPENTVALYALVDVGNPALVDTLAVDAHSTASHAGTYYLALGEAGLAALPPGADQPLTIDDATPTYALLLDGGALYSAGTQLARYDVTTAAAPRQIASVALSGPAQHVTLGSIQNDGTRWLYVSTANGIDPVRQAGTDGALELASQVPLPSGTRKMIVAGNRAYAAPLAGGLLVLSTSDPAQPIPLFTYRSSMGATVQDMLLVEERLIVSWEGGLELLDVGASAPLPSLLAILPTGGAQALDVTLANRQAFVSLGQDGIAVVDVSRPAEAHVLGSLDTPGLASHAAISNDMLFVADGPCGLRAINVGDPSSPQESGFWLTSFTSDVDLSSQDGIVYAANGNALLALRYLPGAPPLPPPTPRDPFPFDGQFEVPTPIQLGWQPPADPCNPLRYEVSLGVGTTPPLLGQVTGEPGLDAGSLRGLTTYHWQVRTTDLQGDMAEGPLWSFTTGRGGPGGFVTPDQPPILLDWLRGVGWVPLALAVSIAFGLLAIRRRRRRRPKQE
jgi:hypothetical protein